VLLTVIDVAPASVVVAEPLTVTAFPVTACAAPVEVTFVLLLITTAPLLPFCVYVTTLAEMLSLLKVQQRQPMLAQHQSLLTTQRQQAKWL